MIKAVIFDMDGLLIDSEPLWKAAETEVFNSVGVPLTDKMALETTGLRTDEVVRYWHHRYPWDAPSIEEIRKKLDLKVLEEVKKHGNPMKGVSEIIAVCESLNLPMAIASSSSIAMIEAVVEKLGIGHKFEIIHSAQFETFGKPHPAVYISAAKKLGVDPEQCLAFEDSANGVLSAKSAKMHCIAVPEPEVRNDKRFGIADRVVNSLNDITSDIIQKM